MYIKNIPLIPSLFTFILSLFLHKKNKRVISKILDVFAIYALLMLYSLNNKEKKQMKILLSILSLLLLHNFAYSNTTSNNTNSTNLNFQFAKAIEAEDIPALEELIEAGVDVNDPKIVRFLGKTPLHYAVFVENVQMTHLLIDAEANVHALNVSDRTPIYWTAFNGNKEIALMLLEKGALPAPIDYFGRTPAFWANYSNYPEIVDILNNTANNTTADADQ